MILPQFVPNFIQNIYKNQIVTLAKQYSLMLFCGLACVSLVVEAVPAEAHVSVQPEQATVATYQTFTVNVPNEKDQNTIALRLVIPDQIESVTPNTKLGWKIDTTKNIQGTITEIKWLAGEIPVGQRDEFVFQAKTPSQVATLNWKAYQTYQDGTIVNWDANPATLTHSNKDKTSDTESKPGPYSSTVIQDDLSDNPQMSQSISTTSNTILGWSYTALGISILAIILSGYTLIKNRIK